MRRAEVLKLVLWFCAGAFAVVAAARMLFGLGATTALTDTFPWGLWKMFNVVACVPVAAGGFVLAGIFYIFHMKRYKPIMRATVLMALLGYSSVAASLTLDIGVPWRIWFPMIHWQHHSVLFEVAWCIILYLNVLLLEFSPTVLERLPFAGLLKLIKKATIVLVIIGIGLSVLHQSSLGTLFLIMPFRLHPLWYTWLLPLLFLLSAIGLGIMAVIGLTLLVGWLYRKDFDLDMLSRLARGASYFMGAYFLVRIIDIIATGKFSLIWAGGFDSVNFCMESLLSVLIPVALLQFPKVRNTKAGLAACSIMVILGTVLYRMNCSGIAMMTSIKEFYFPAWTEIVFTVGIVSGAGIVFLFLVEHFSVYPHIGKGTEQAGETPRFDAISHDWTSPIALAGYRQYSFMFILGAALASAFLPNDAVRGAQPVRCPVQRSRRTLAVKLLDNRGKTDGLARSDAKDACEVLVLDGNRNQRFVLFNHDAHVKREGDKKSCVLCHHMNMPEDRETACGECHCDMYSPTPLFNHDYHVQQLNGNEGCVECHKDPAAPKNRETATPCAECHKDLRVAGSRIAVPTDRSKQFLAVGYEQAMHGLCISCHKERHPDVNGLPAVQTRCSFCHGHDATQTASAK
ncbi:MAG: Ni/Fe-hydrogenase cytochrome b subunit [Planctomycetes bacterium]|nr:Ni/Fe-hydrogenase cytochrome b subunit [Planctomycetota bacterium]